MGMSCSIQIVHRNCSEATLQLVLGMGTGRGVECARFRAVWTFARLADETPVVWTRSSAICHLAE